MGTYVLICRFVVLPQVSTKDKEEELRRMQEKYGVDGEEHAKKK